MHAAPIISTDGCCRGAGPVSRDDARRIHTPGSALWHGAVPNPPRCNSLSTEHLSVRKAHLHTNATGRTLWSRRSPRCVLTLAVTPALTVLLPASESLVAVVHLAHYMMAGHFGDPLGQAPPYVRGQPEQAGCGQAPREQDPGGGEPSADRSRSVSPAFNSLTKTLCRVCPSW